MQTKAYYNRNSITLSEKKSQKPLKVTAEKKSFSSPCTIDTTCFDERFLFHVIIGRHCF